MGIPLSGLAPTLGVPPLGDQANAVIAGTFTATGVSSAFVFYGAMNISIYGAGGSNTAWSGSVRLERSFDGGTTWLVCNVGGNGGQAIYATGTDVTFVNSEPERGVAYRLRCTSYVSGTITYRISQTGVLGTSNGISS